MDHIRGTDTATRSNVVGFPELDGHPPVKGTGRPPARPSVSSPPSEHCHRYHQTPPSNIAAPRPPDDVTTCWPRPRTATNSSCEKCAVAWTLSGQRSSSQEGRRHRAGNEIPIRPGHCHRRFQCGPFACSGVTILLAGRK